MTPFNTTFRQITPSCILEGIVSSERHCLFSAAAEVTIIFKSTPLPLQVASSHFSPFIHNHSPVLSIFFAERKEHVTGYMDSDCATKVDIDTDGDIVSKAECESVASVRDRSSSQ